MSVSITPRASARTWWGLAILVLPALLISMDISILFVASTAVTAALEPTATQWLWMMDVYGFVMAGLLITMGGLGDRIGRRRLLMIGAAAFGIASAAIALTDSPVAFIAGRALLGAAAATLAPSTLSLIRHMFTEETERAKAVGVWTVAFTGGTVAGPLIGGVLLEYFWWGVVFLINVPVMVLLLVTAPSLIPESRHDRPVRFDLPGAATSLPAILALVYAIKRFAEHGPDTTAVLAVVAGLACGAMFVRRQLRAPYPLIDLRLFRRAAFTVAVGSFGVVAVAVAGVGLLAFTFLQSVHGLTPLWAAIWSSPTFVGTLIGAGIGTGLAGRVPAARLLPVGLIVAASGFAVLTTVRPDSPLPLFIAGYVVLTTGIGLVGTVANSLILSSAPPQRSGAAAGISETSQELGAALGIAVLGTIATAVYRAGTDGVAGAGHTVTEAVQAAAGLADPRGTALRETAFAAFTTGINVAAGAGALAVVAMAIAAMVTWRRAA